MFYKQIMSRSFIANITTKGRLFDSLFSSNKNVMLGRWNLKHDITDCDNYINNYYGEPGYPNKSKEVWIEKIEKIEKINKIQKKI